MKRILLLLAVLLLAFPQGSRAVPIGAACAEADGDPSGWAYKFVFPNGTLSIANGVGTYTGGAGGGVGDVDSVGDCASGACGDGSSDGGTYYRFYDGDSNYVQLGIGNLGANYTFNLPLSTDVTDEYLCSWEATGTKLVCDKTVGTDVQAYDADLSTLAALALGAMGLDLLEAADETAVQALLAYINELSEDTSPTLGGDLDMGAFGIYGAFTTLTVNSATPSVAVGVNFLTANTLATTITDFTGTITGMPFRVIINDALTTVQFSNAAFRGHGEVDLATPPAGTILSCIDNGTTIDCDVSEWTSLALATFLFPQGTTPAQTAEGSVYWDTDDNLLTVGDGATRKTMVDIASTQALDFGGATSVEIPNGNNPTTDAAGEIALDVNNVALEVFAATASRLIPTVYTKELTIPEPDKQQAILDAWPIFRVDVTAFPFGITVTSCYITLSADAAYVAVFEEWTGDPPAQTADIETVTTGAGDSYMEDTTPANPTIEADNYVYVDLPTTDVPMVQVQISYTVNEGN